MEKFSSHLEAISKIVQALAILAGIVFGVHEFVIKDRDQDRQLHDLTIKQADRLRSEEVKQSQHRLSELRELAFDTPVSPKDIEMRLKVAQQFHRETRDLAHFYALIHRCTEAGFCKRDLVQVLVCEDALIDLTTISELQGRLGSKLFTPDFFRSLPLFAERNCGAHNGQILFVK
ncbi:MAG TPA: hypothetical protein PKJ04_08330 [Nitrospira sp.]|nr:hypothetical protein [Nitrospira sp.]MBX3338451.1 hypothetical protein [Nitrospira sp.]MCW5781458.1 hypothetical protein [Nitrospira sp.]MCW5795449.1 hypothetical protein [Nitrospira sp.]HNL88885.1 hypothetical protein [Nitrospira sp.]